MSSTMSATTEGSESQTGVRPENESEFKLAPESLPQKQSEPESAALPEMRTGTEAESEPEFKPAPESLPQKQAEPESEALPEMRPGTEAESEPVFKPAPESLPPKQLEPEPAAVPEMRSVTEAESEPKFEQAPESLPQKQSEPEPGAMPEVRSGTEAESEPEFKPAPESLTQKQSEPEPAAMLEMRSGMEAESEPEFRQSSESLKQKPSEPEPAALPEMQSIPQVESKPEVVSLLELEPKPKPVVTDVDRKPREGPQPQETPANQQNESGNVSATPGSRTFTMRELLNDVNDDEETEKSPGSPDASPYSQQSMPILSEKNIATMDLISSVTGVDEESRSRQRILTFAARRYASAIERNPDDYDALYNWALVLQESADNVSPDSTSPTKDALLEEACKKYDEATHLCPTLHDAFYNWAIAISDRAKMRGRTKEAEELWKQSAANYEKAVQLNWNSPQALNNWGLALQELSAIVQVREKPAIVRTAISKFRSAIMLQFDFHRAIYNLGTVLYGLAEDSVKESGNPKEVPRSSNELYSQSAIYIAAAHALRPNYSVYSSALRLVRSMLPLPYLKVGYLKAPPVRTPLAPHKDWKRTQFVVNHEGLHQAVKAEPKQAPQSLSGKPEEVMNGERSGIRVGIADIVSVSACVDLTLPPGAGLRVETNNEPVFLVADSWEALEGWLDAIRLVYTIHARGKGDVLSGIISG